MIQNISKKTASYGVGAEIGLKRAGLFLQRESQKIVPVAKGNLKGSAFTRKFSGSGLTAKIIVGYTSEYAIYVHEDLDARHKKGKTAKYLEKPMREKHLELLGIIKTGMER